MSLETRFLGLLLLLLAFDFEHHHWRFHREPSLPFFLDPPSSRSSTLLRLTVPAGPARWPGIGFQPKKQHTKSKGWAADSGFFSCSALRKLVSVHSHLALLLPWTDNQRCNHIHGRCLTIAAQAQLRIYSTTFGVASSRPDTFLAVKRAACDHGVPRPRRWLRCPSDAGSPSTSRPGKLFLCGSGSRPGVASKC